MTTQNSDKRAKLIEQYESRLAKVKLLHDPNKASSTVVKERCLEFIKFAEEQLEEVKRGREW